MTISKINFNIMLYLASDHAGFELKEKIKFYLKNNNILFMDLGTDSKENVDYPGYARLLTKKVSNDSRGILICGTGVGMSIVANRSSGIRAALCFNDDMVKLARNHNDANVMVLGSKFVKFEEIDTMVGTFLKERFEGGRHLRRINDIDK